MKCHKLRYLSLFSEDLNSIVHYIPVVLRNPAATRHLVDGVETAIQEHLNMTEPLAPFPSTRTHKHPYYPIYVRNFIVFYAVSGDMTEVRRISYNRCNISAIL